MRVTATSTFHGSLSVVFNNCHEGVNIRRLRGPRTKYCLDYSHANSHVCGCGYPCARTNWDAGQRFGVEGVAECGRDGGQGRGYIAFNVFDAVERAESERDFCELEQAALMAELNPDGTFKN